MTEFNNTLPPFPVVAAGFGALCGMSVDVGQLSVCPCAYSYVPTVMVS
jgi:hypothetical protein